MRLVVGLFGKDLGKIHADGADSSAIRSSVGASLMWASPVGPIRMDFAQVLTKEPYDVTQFFRFGASSKF